MLALMMGSARVSRRVRRALVLTAVRLAMDERFGYLAAASLNDQPEPFGQAPVERGCQHPAGPTRVVQEQDDGEGFVVEGARQPIGARVTPSDAPESHVERSIEDAERVPDLLDVAK